MLQKAIPLRTDTNMFTQGIWRAITHQGRGFFAEITPSSEKIQLPLWVTLAIFFPSVLPRHQNVYAVVHLLPDENAWGKRSELIQSKFSSHVHILKKFAFLSSMGQSMCLAYVMAQKNQKTAVEQPQFVFSVSENQAT